jgi:hypothetical protein
MSSPHRPFSRRTLMRGLLFGSALLPLAARLAKTAHAAPASLLAVGSPEAKAVQYTEDAKSAHTRQPGSSCANCALYQGAEGSAQGPCQIFPGKEVKAAGWCSSWAAQM